MSSTWDSCDWKAFQMGGNFARLHRKEGLAGCWVAAANSRDQWLEVDLGEQCLVTGVATQVLPILSHIVF